MLMGLLLLNGSCTNRGSKEEEVAKVRLLTVRTAGNPSVQDFPGRVVAAEEVNLAFKLGGTLMRIHVKKETK